MDCTLGAMMPAATDAGAMCDFHAGLFDLERKEA
jgi:hypothetical protein